MKRMAVTASGLYNLSVGKISGVPVPPLAEQRRVVAKVDELMALCDDLEARLSHARDRSAALAASVLHHLAVA